MISLGSVFAYSQRPHGAYPLVQTAFMAPATNEYGTCDGERRSLSKNIITSAENKVFPLGGVGVGSYP